MKRKPEPAAGGVPRKLIVATPGPAAAFAHAPDVTARIVAKPKPAVLPPLTGLPFYVYAERFLEAAEALPPAQGFAAQGFSPVPYYLYCHSIELALKAFLSVQGVPEAEIRSKKLGHNLVRVAERAEALSLARVYTLSGPQWETIRTADPYYGRKGFEYLDPRKALLGYKGLPDLESLRALARDLVRSMKRPSQLALHAPPPLFRVGPRPMIRTASATPREGRDAHVAAPRVGEDVGGSPGSWRGQGLLIRSFGRGSECA
jgi:hypothetical protein